MPLCVCNCKQETWQFLVPITRGFGSYIVPENWGIKRGLLESGADNSLLWEAVAKLGLVKVDKQN